MSQKQRKTLLVIAGPTAIGKTDLSIHLALRLGLEIVSADSRQIFRELDIGTAKPSAEQLATVRHHFVSSHSVTEDYNAFRYETEALAVLEGIFQRSDAALLVGGSGLYLDAVCKGISDLPSVDAPTRAYWNEVHQREGLEGLRLNLKHMDPESYRKIDLRNPLRIQKALEITSIAGVPYSSLLDGVHKDRPFRIVRMALDTDRALLYERINRRAEAMFASGLVEEARGLLAHRHRVALKTVGYRECFDLLDGKTSPAEALERVQANTRNYARKQLSWLRRDKHYQWFNPNDENLLNWAIQQIKSQETIVNR